MMKVLHLTAHLGGGIGKALSGLAAQAHQSGADVRHTFVCFEQPEKMQFIDLIRQSDNAVIVNPSTEQLYNLIENTDILQLEWWNHPATLRALCSLPRCSARLIVWSHLSGLLNPIIPIELMRKAQRALLTSSCSLAAKEVASLTEELGDRLGVVSSSGGYAGLPLPSSNPIDETLKVGYFGSLNFAKLHPAYIDYLSAVTLPHFKVRVIGDLTNQEELNQQCIKSGRPDMLEFRGYVTNIASELTKINVLAYLLNPEHYGTTENALLEAMATGIVPVVLDNPAERRIIENGETGFIVHSPKEFSDVIAWLSNHPKERQRIGTNAAKSVRTQFTVERMEASLNAHYQAVVRLKKIDVMFKEIFGNDPADWFLSCQGNRTVFMEDGQINLDKGQAIPFGLIEKNKGTVFHFHRIFPENYKLAMWANNLAELH